MTICIGNLALVTRSSFDKEWDKLYDETYKGRSLQEESDQRAHNLLCASVEILNRRLFGSRNK